MNKHAKENRIIELEGSFNFRDMGGYPTNDGYHVKWGMLFRSGNLSGMTEADMEIVNQLGIKKICDLRATDEINKHPDPEINGATWIHVPVIQDEVTIKHAGDLVAPYENGEPGGILVSINREMATYTEAFQKVFKVLLDKPEDPFLFHCMAGKDRTGVVAALILSVLGVPREIILEDYLFTNLSFEKIKANLLTSDSHQLQQMNQEVLDALLEARLEYIEAFFDQLERTYLSVDSFIKWNIGLTNADIEKLKKNLLG